MPELPDVEVMRRQFESVALDKKISSFVVFDHRVLAETGDEELRIALEGDRFVQTKRHGKYLLARLAGEDRIAFQLMNQKIMAGLGNIYTDEILFQSGIHPQSEVQNLISGDWNRIYLAMHVVIETAVEKGERPRSAACPIPHSLQACRGEMSRVRIRAEPHWDLRAMGFACSKCQLRPSQLCLRQI